MEIFGFKWKYFWNWNSTVKHIEQNVLMILWNYVKNVVLNQVEQKTGHTHCRFTILFWGFLKNTWVIWNLQGIPMSILPQSSDADKSSDRLLLESAAKNSENPEGPKSACRPLQYKEFLNQLLSRERWRTVLPWGCGDQINNRFLWMVIYVCQGHSESVWASSFPKSKAASCL